MLALAELVSFFSECNMSRSTTTWEDASTTRASASLVYYFFSDLVGLTLALVLVLIVKIIIRKIQSNKKIKEFLLFFYFFDNVSYTNF